MHTQTPRLRSESAALNGASRCTAATESVTMERPVLFAVARVTLRIGESSGADPHTKGTGRMSKIRFLGLDVHADTITVAIAEPGKEVSLYGRIPNQLEAVR